LPPGDAVVYSARFFCCGECSQIGITLCPQGRALRGVKLEKHRIRRLNRGRTLRRRVRCIRPYMQRAKAWLDSVKGVKHRSRNKSHNARRDDRTRTAREDRIVHDCILVDVRTDDEGGGEEDCCVHGQFIPRVSAGSWEPPRYDCPFSAMVPLIPRLRRGIN